MNSGGVETSLGFFVLGPERFEVRKEWTWLGLAITACWVQKPHYLLPCLFPGGFAAPGV